MSRNLSTTIRDMLIGYNHRNYYYAGYDLSNTLLYNKKYMEVPIRDAVFEVPAFAYDSLSNLCHSPEGKDVDAIAVLLNSNGGKIGYKTLERNMVDILVTAYNPFNRMFVVDAKAGNQDIQYFSTFGAVFDMDYNPMMMLSYQIERVENYEGTTSGVLFKPIRAILRVSPTVLNMDDSMQKLIMNKVVKLCVQHRQDHIPGVQNHASLKVEIDECPFLIHNIGVPSVSTTNSQLLQLAIDHIDEVVV